MDASAEADMKHMDTHSHSTKLLALSNCSVQLNETRVRFTLKIVVFSVLRYVCAAGCGLCMCHDFFYMLLIETRQPVL